MNGSAAAGNSVEASAGDHVHPSDTSKLDASSLGQPNGPAALDAQGHFDGLAFVFSTAQTLTQSGMPIRPYASPDTSHAYIDGGDYTSEYSGMPATIYQQKQDGVIWTVTCQTATYDSGNNRTVLTADPGSFGTSGYVSATPGSAFVCGSFNTVSGICAYAEGLCNVSSGNYAHAEGRETTASGLCSHAEGHGTTASGNYSHAEGYASTASGNFSHAEGYQTTASGHSAHAEGNITHAVGNYSTLQATRAWPRDTIHEQRATRRPPREITRMPRAMGPLPPPRAPMPRAATPRPRELNAHAEGYYTEAAALGSRAIGIYSLAAKQFQVGPLVRKVRGQRRRPAD